jgi:hypothetical protein
MERNANLNLAEQYHGDAIRNQAIGTVFYALAPFLMGTPAGVILPIASIGAGMAMHWMAHRQSNAADQNTLMSRPEYSALANARDNIKEYLATSNVVSLICSGAMMFAVAGSPVVPLAMAATGIVAAVQAIRVGIECYSYQNQNRSES